MDFIQAAYCMHKIALRTLLYVTPEIPLVLDLTASQSRLSTIETTIKAIIVVIFAMFCALISFLQRSPPNDLVIAPYRPPQPPPELRHRSGKDVRHFSCSACAVPRHALRQYPAIDLILNLGVVPIARNGCDGERCGTSRKNGGDHVKDVLALDLRREDERSVG